MKHATKLQNENVIIKQITTLRYDALGDFLNNFAIQLMDDATADDVRGRYELAKCLREASDKIYSASTKIIEAWQICKKHMKVK